MERGRRQNDKSRRWLGEAEASWVSAVRRARASKRLPAPRVEAVEAAVAGWSWSFVWPAGLG